MSTAATELKVSIGRPVACRRWSRVKKAQRLSRGVHSWFFFSAMPQLLGNMSPVLLFFFQELSWMFTER